MEKQNEWVVVCYCVLCLLRSQQDATKWVLLFHSLQQPLSPLSVEFNQKHMITKLGFYWRKWSKQKIEIINLTVRQSSVRRDWRSWKDVKFKDMDFITIFRPWLLGTHWGLHFCEPPTQVIWCQQRGRKLPITFHFRLFHHNKYGHRHIFFSSHFPQWFANLPSLARKQNFLVSTDAT